MYSLVSPLSSELGCRKKQKKKQAQESNECLQINNLHKDPGGPIITKIYPGFHDSKWLRTLNICKKWLPKHHLIYKQVALACTPPPKLLTRVKKQIWENGHRKPTCMLHSSKNLWINSMPFSHTPVYNTWTNSKWYWWKGFKWLSGIVNSVSNSLLGWSATSKITAVWEKKIGIHVNICQFANSLFEIFVRQTFIISFIFINFNQQQFLPRWRVCWLNDSTGHWLSHLHLGHCSSGLPVTM